MKDGKFFCADKPSMKSLKISQTIYVLLGLALLAGGISSTYLLYRCSVVSERYTSIIQNEIAQAEQVRVVQVNFKKQVQAWKDILLRGKDDGSLEKYSKEFHALAAQVDEQGTALVPQLSDETAHRQLEEFIAQHKVLDGQYEAALSGYRLSRDFAQADAAVKGKDRQPTNTLDGIVEQLTGKAKSVPAEQAAQLRHQQHLLTGVLILIWAGLLGWGVSFVRQLGVRLDASVSFVRKIARGDLTAESHAAVREDELGDLIAAMIEMRDQLRVVVSEIQKVAGAVSRNAGGVSNSSSRIAAAVAEQRAQATQVAAALEQMIASVHEVTDHCNEAAERAAHTGDLAGDSSTTVESVAYKVRELADEARVNARSVLELGERSSRVGQIVTLIEEIASQTNLLALNAAIESARAGEQGRGFAVVAGEVRRLAERTTAATREIAEAVDSIQQGTSHAVESIEASSEHVIGSVETANEAARSLGLLGTGATEVRQRIERIAQAANEQAEASREVGASMNEISSRIHSSSESAEETARAAEELLTLAQQLNEQANRFRI